MNTEIKVGEYAFLVSEISEDGIIRFASDDFCKLSGYSLDELFGKSLSIIYHEDMPQQIIEELSTTTQGGKTWVGYIKNKTKNGDFFWTFTNIYPFLSSDGSAGYLSCRKKASDQEILEYTQLYKRMKS